MIADDRRASVVVTGCGTVNALGHDVDSFWSRLVGGACGIRRISGEREGDAELYLAPVTDLPPVGAVNGAAAALSRTAGFALAAAAQAVHQSGLARAYPGERIGIVLGTTTGGIRETEDYFIDRQHGRAAPRSRLLAFEKACAAEALARRFGFSGPRYTVHTACASGASAILLGAQLIREGLAAAVLAGGSDSLGLLTISGFRSVRALSQAPCRPFDRHRRGLSLGEGAGLVVLESSSGASARGAPILAQLLSAAQTTDAYHLTAPPADGAGAARAIRRALALADLPPSSVDHVNAHGTGTLPNDAAESAAIHAALGAHAARVPVTSVKGAIGHTLGAAGAIEAIAAIQTLRTGLAPPTVGLEEPDPEMGLDFVSGRARAGDWRTVLSNSFGFGGANAVLCLGWWKT